MFRRCTQCFDLRNYIASNAYVSGSRFRCASCEEFVSLQNLEICGLTTHLLQEFEKVASPERDRVQVCADGSYVLLEERKVRGTKRQNCDFGTMQAPAKSQKNSEEDVIEIL